VRDRAGRRLVGLVRLGPRLGPRLRLRFGFRRGVRAPAVDLGRAGRPVGGAQQCRIGGHRAGHRGAGRVGAGHGRDRSSGTAEGVGHPRRDAGHGRATGRLAGQRRGRPGRFGGVAPQGARRGRRRQFEPFVLTVARLPRSVRRFAVALRRSLLLVHGVLPTAAGRRGGYVGRCPYGATSARVRAPGVGQVSDESQTSGLLRSCPGAGVSFRGL